MIHPDTELFFVDAIVGHGVRATRAIPRGTLVWTQCRLDLVLERPLDRLGPAYAPLVERYAYVDHRGRYVLCWDNGRYVNHACSPNARGLGPSSQIAVRDIAAGEQVTCDYGECNLEETLRCRCGSSACRGEISGADALAFAETWDAEIAAAVRAARGLPQPLLPFVDHGDWVARILAGDEPAPSIRGLRWDGASGPG